MNFCCERCHKTFAKKQNLEYHVQHQVCLKSLHVCMLCQKQLSSKQMLQYHLSHVACHAPEGTSGPSGRRLVHPVAFGTEDLQLITTRCPQLFSVAINEHTDRCIEYLFEQIHCNPQTFPEYLNLYARSATTKILLVCQGTHFSHMPVVSVMDTLIENMMSMIQKHLDTENSEIDMVVIERYEKYCDLIESKGKKTGRRRDLETQIIAFLLNIKPVMDPHLKTREGQLGVLFEIEPVQKLIT
jgi:hypothetical protein